MKTIKFSPAPWTLHRDGDEWLLIMSGGPAGQIVANVNAKSCPDHQSAPCFRVMPQSENAALLVSAPEMHAKLVSLAEAWAEEFDNGDDEPADISGADLIEWFDAFRREVKKLLATIEERAKGAE